MIDVIFRNRDSRITASVATGTTLADFIRANDPTGAIAQASHNLLVNGQMVASWSTFTFSDDTVAYRVTAQFKNKDAA